jgi:hypothetical protein
MSSTDQPAPPTAEAPYAALAIQLRERDGRLSRLPLTQGSFRIGSAPDCDLVLADLARNHLLVVCSGDTVTVADLGGAGGARLNGLLLDPYEEKPWPLRATVLAGSPAYPLTLVADQLALQAVVESEVEPAAAPQAALAVSVEPREQKVRPGRPLELRVTIVNRGPARRSFRVMLDSDGALGTLLQRGGALQDVDIESGGVPETLRFAVPVERRPTSRAGKYLLAVTLKDLDSHLLIDPETQPCSVTVEPYYDPPRQLEVIEFGQRRGARTPLQRSDSRQVTFRLNVLNPSNSTTFYRLKADADTNDVSCRVSSDLLVVEPGDQRSFELYVQAKSDVNYNTLHTVSVEAQPTGLRVEPITAPPLLFLQTPPRGRYWWVPWAVGAGALLLLALFFAVWSLMGTLQAAREGARQTAAASLIESERPTLRAYVAAQQLTQVAAITGTLTAQLNATATAQAIGAAAVAAQSQTLQPVLDAATALVSERAAQANLELVAQTVTAQVGATAEAIGATSRAEIAAVAERATGEAGQTASAVAAATILVQAQQQQTTFAQSRTDVAQSNLRSTELAAPASLVIGPVQRCVVKNAKLDAVSVEVRDGNGRRAETIPVTISLELQSVGQPSRARLRGQTKVVSEKGGASFSGLSIDRVGVYRLLAQSEGWTPVESEDIQVVGEGGACDGGVENRSTPVATQGDSDAAPVLLESPVVVTPGPPPEPALAPTP